MPPSTDKHPPAWLVLLLLTLAAVAVHTLAIALPAPPDADDMAVIGLIALHALRGDFSAFFYGESNGGTIESLVAASPLWLFGLSTEVLSLAAPYSSPWSSSGAPTWPAPTWEAAGPG